MAINEAEFIKTVLNQRSLEASMKELSTEQINLAIEKMQNVRDAKAEREAAEAARKAAFEGRMNDLLELIEGEQFTIEEFFIHCREKGLLTNITNADGTLDKRKTNHRKGPMPPKYLWVDPETSKEKTWTGAGRCPISLAKRMEIDNQEREAYLIKKEETQNAE